jgi:site-specific DNA-methyltransferase (adenine-specific)
MKTEQYNITNEDNMLLMSRYEDNYFDLAIVDPPYGIGISGQKESKKGKKSDRKYHEEKQWDNSIPNESYFKELKRVSKNQIIWGANYFVEHLKEGHKGWIVWDKAQHGLTMSDCELAYSSFDCPTRVWIKNRAVLINQNTIHPTEKPIKLYEWLFKNYAEPNQKILDTHLGSGSIAIALNNMNNIEKMNLHLTACELDKDYFEASTLRIQQQTRQQTIF